MDRVHKPKTSCLLVCCCMATTFCWLHCYSNIMWFVWRPWPALCQVYKVAILDKIKREWFPGNKIRNECISNKCKLTTIQNRIVLNESMVILSHFHFKSFQAILVLPVSIYITLQTISLCTCLPLHYFTQSLFFWAFWLPLIPLLLLVSFRSVAAVYILY